MPSGGGDRAHDPPQGRPDHGEKHSMATSRRLDRECRTVAIMVHYYCAHKHGTEGDLCPKCRELVDHARLRITACPFGDAKTTCARCQVHCYSVEMRERIRMVMRYAGPHMLLRHPLLTLAHALDSFRLPPEKPLF